MVLWRFLHIFKNVYGRSWTLNLSHFLFINGNKTGIGVI